MKNSSVTIIVMAVLAFVLIVIVALNVPKETDEINSFEECANKGYPVMESYPRQCRANGMTFTEQVLEADLDEYFFEEMIGEANENIGVMPVEGYSPDLYMGAFSGLKKEDFQNVEAYGGIWKMRNGELVFERNVPQNEITSADGTVNAEGMKTLLDNLSKRLNINVESKEDVDILIASLNYDY